MAARSLAGHRKNSQWWLVLLLIACRSQATESYRLDSTNTRVWFTVQHFGFEWINARFNDMSGEFVLDRTGPASQVDVRVAIASLDCPDPRWKERLRSPEWLDARRFPQMIFHSTRVELQDQRAVASGNLSLHGVTRPVVLTVTLLNCAAGSPCRFAAHGRIRRSEFGLPHGVLIGGDQVDISISGTIEGTRGAH
jgi:polyisoprenoid-binding protein YceI